MDRSQTAAAIDVYKDSNYIRIMEYDEAICVLNYLAIL